MSGEKYGPRKTLDPLNQFAFNCPVFHANTKIAACFMLRELVARGDRPATRRGCQVAMDACKCPIDVILADMRRKNDDPYHSTTAKVGKLNDSVLERTSLVLVLERNIERAELSPQEAAALRKCNDDAHTDFTKIVKKPRRRDPTPAEMETLVAKPKIKSETVVAAATGDMSAAVNAEIKAGESA